METAAASEACSHVSGTNHIFLDSQDPVELAQLALVKFLLSICLLDQKKLTHFHCMLGSHAVIGFARNAEAKHTVEFAQKAVCGHRYARWQSKVWHRGRRIGICGRKKAYMTVLAFSAGGPLHSDEKFC